MAKKILYKDDARAALMSGINAAVDAAKITIGPKGRNVALANNFGGPTITNDGVSIVKEISLSDPFANMGVEMVKQVAGKTNDTAGDGTTTSSILFQAIVQEGMKHLKSGLSVMEIKKGIDRATTDIINVLEGHSKKVNGIDDIKHVASISAESTEMGGLIAQTIERVGEDGVVTVEESQGLDMTSEVVEGMQFDKGYISPYMVTDSERMEAIYENVPILIYDKKVSNVKEILPILEALSAKGQKELVIIAEDIDGEALTTFVVNKLRGALNVLGIKAPGFGDRRNAMLEDIAIVTGAIVVSTEKGMNLEGAPLDVLGKVKRIISTKDSTTIIDGSGLKKDIDTRVAQLKAQLENTTSSYDSENIVKRIAKLAGGIAVMKVGAATETEMKYLKLKIEDAVNATKAAIEEGIVAGGGTALVHAAETVRTSVSEETLKELEVRAGYEIILKACEAPLRQIAINAGFGDGSVIVEKINISKSRSKNAPINGYDFVADEVVVDMIKAGIIDPLKVTRNALLNASSAAGTFLTTEVAIADDPSEKKDTPAMPSMGGMPGMGF